MIRDESDGYNFQCPLEHCLRWFRSTYGLTQHIQAIHPDENVNVNALVHTEPLDIMGGMIHDGSLSSEKDSDDEILDTPLQDNEDIDMDNVEVSAETPPVVTDTIPPAIPPASPIGNERREEQEASQGSRSDATSDDDQQQDQIWREYHPYLTGEICNKNGEPIPPDSRPPPPEEPSKDPDDWGPFESRLRFEMADVLYRRAQVSGRDIDEILQLWSASLLEVNPDADPPFKNHRDLYQMIDDSNLAEIPWEPFSSSYQGKRPETGPIPEWMSTETEGWYRDPRKLIHNIIGRPDFRDEIDYAPYHEYVGHGDQKKHRFHNLFSGDWAWKQADTISQDESTHGAAFVPIILGSDKTTVSVGTGNNEYWPVYLSIGNIHNNVRRSHRNGMVLLGFFGIPKTEKKHRNDAKYRKYRRQLFHTSLNIMLERLKPAFTTPEVVLCGDGHYRRIIYGLGPYIADYPEQCLVACIVQGWCTRCLAPAKDLDNPTHRNNPRTLQHTILMVENLELGAMWKEYGLVGDVVPFTEYFPRADVHELLSPDILHQLIKGAFKDHLVTWIEEWVYATYSKEEADEIIDEVDRRIASVPAFAGLRRFPHGRGFKQWTGDDSQALMKVYLAALEGLIPDRMVRTLRYLIEFCSLVRRDVQDTATIKKLEETLKLYHENRQVFIDTEIRTDKQPPRQHCLVHYPKLIRAFGAPNGLCSSITESKHIKAVKEPWRRSNRFKALGQMLITNQRLDKLAASRVDFETRGMLKGKYLKNVLADIEEREVSSSSEGDTDSSWSTGGRRQKPRKEKAPQVDSDEEEDVSGPKRTNSIELAKTVIRRGVYAEIIAEDFEQSNLIVLIRKFLYQEQLRRDQQARSRGSNTSTSLPASDHPSFSNEHPINTYNSAVAIFYAPSDLSGVGGMRKERIRAVSRWRGGGSRFDTVLVKPDPTLENQVTVKSYTIARVRLLFSFTYEQKSHACALLHDFEVVDSNHTENTGMAIVRRGFRGGRPIARVVALDDILRAVHLIPVFSESGKIPRGYKHESTLDDRELFKRFYVNKYIDHHAFEILS